MRTALASSLNVPAVRTADMVGVDQFVEHLRALGFADVTQEGDYYGGSVALGSADVTVWQIVNAYRTLATGGQWSPCESSRALMTRYIGASIMTRPPT